MTLPGDELGPSDAVDSLDPDIQRFVREMGAGWARHPELATATPAQARRIADVVRAPWTRGGPAMATVDERSVPTRHGAVRVRRYVPTAGAPLPRSSTSTAVVGRFSASIPTTG